MYNRIAHISLLSIPIMFGCGSEPEYKSGTFGYDYRFLKEHQEDAVLLTDTEEDALVLVSPEYQGRVMTSTAEGMEGGSYGWLNYDLIASGELYKHINVFGGEDRFWIGPEGGQYSVFFEKDTEFIFDNWFTPAPIDTESYEISRVTPQSITFQKEFKLLNYAGTEFSLYLDREIRMLPKNTVGDILGTDVSGLQIVGFESVNEITNKNSFGWDRITGMPSIWILGMFNPTEKTVVFAPYNTPSDSSKLVTDDYFGKIPPDRLKVTNKFILFRGDGKSRGKFGLRYGVSKDIIGSYSPELGLLSIVTFTMPETSRDYVNSLWKYQEKPFEGDVVNSYNDGPLEDGTQLGAFYELESSSPAANLQPGETLKHVHTTIHIKGNKEKLNNVFYEIFDGSLKDISF